MPYAGRCRLAPLGEVLDTGDGKAHLGSETLLVVDDAAPSKVEVIVLDANETTGLEEGKSVGRVVKNVAKVLVEDVELLTKLVVIGNVVLILNDNVVLARVEGAKLCTGREGQRVRATDEQWANSPSSRCGTEAVFWN